MCYNCGCRRPNDQMGNPANITEDTIQKAAQASEQTIEEAKKNMIELLQKTLNKSAESSNEN